MHFTGIRGLRQSNQFGNFIFHFRKFRPAPEHGGNGGNKSNSSDPESPSISTSSVNLKFNNNLETVKCDKNFHHILSYHWKINTINL